MSVCLGCSQRAGTRIIDSRPARDDLGRVVTRRVVICPRCGPRLQTISDEGPTSKLYVVTAISVSTRSHRGKR